MAKLFVGGPVGAASGRYGVLLLASPPSDSASGFSDSSISAKSFFGFEGGGAAIPRHPTERLHAAQKPFGSRKSSVFRPNSDRPQVRESQVPGALTSWPASCSCRFHLLTRSNFYAGRMPALPGITQPSKVDSVHKITRAIESANGRNFVGIHVDASRFHPSFPFLAAKRNCDTNRAALA